MARPREFDTDQALDDVISVFWRKGFEGTSLHDIEAATGLNKQSLYRLFPDKRSMYLAALERYAREELEQANKILSGGGDAKQRFQKLFGGLVALAQAGKRSGCFLCNAAVDQVQLDKETKALVNASLKNVERRFREALAQSPPYQGNAERTAAMAALLMAAYFGVRVLTRANAPLPIIRAAALEAVDKI